MDEESVIGPQSKEFRCCDTCDDPTACSNWDSCRRACKGCGAVGFGKSILGSNRCTFCDGTEGGNPPIQGEQV